MSRVNIVPVDDVVEHEESLDCVCTPDEDGDLIVHHSFDGREHLEPDHNKDNCKFCITEPINE